MAPADYLTYERQQEVRHELVDGYLYAMTGASDRHEQIALNLASALRVRLRGSSNCRVYKGDLKIRQADDFYHPDVFVRRADGRETKTLASPEEHLVVDEIDFSMSLADLCA